MSRKPSLKPKPRPENAILLTKKLVATSQLETAIWLWFQDAHPVPILMLAFNAHEIFHALGKKIEKPSRYQTWLETMPKRFQLQSRYVWNYCKHGWLDLEEDTPHDPAQAEVLIYFAGRCYRELYGSPTLLMRAFDLRLVIERPEFTYWESEQAVAKLRDIYKAADIKRAEFLKEYLPLLEKALLHSEAPPA
jgi:hypothetical protein